MPASLPVNQDLKIELEVFEGPLDLLLYLIKRDEIDIYDIPIVSITEQYMEYLRLMQMLDLNIAGEFIVMAATLMAIKSRMLLPPDERPEIEEEDDVDPRLELVRQLVEYKRFKDAASHLHALEQHQGDIFEPGAKPPVPDPEPGLALQEVSLFDLLAAFNHVLKQIESEDLREMFREQFTVADKIDTLLGTLRGRDSLLFAELFSHSASRHEIVCTFLALLELLRLNQIRVTQKGRFGDILIVAGAEAVPA